MELKKSPKADLENKKTYFLEIGFIVALALMIGMFSWSQKERIIEVVEQEVVAVETEMVEITVQEDKRPPAPVKTQAVAISDILNVVKNDTKIEEVSLLDMDVSMDIAVDVSKFGGSYTGDAGVEIDDDPILFAEKMPSFQGGDVNTFTAWCQKNVRYPAAAVDNGEQGIATVRFIVERDGSVTKAEIFGKRIAKSLEAEALRVVNSSPKWSPGLNNGKPVRIYVVVPIEFVLQ